MLDPREKEDSNALWEEREEEINASGIYDDDDGGGSEGSEEED